MNLFLSNFFLKRINKNDISWLWALHTAGYQWDDDIPPIYRSITKHFNSKTDPVDMDTSNSFQHAIKNKLASHQNWSCIQFKNGGYTDSDRVFGNSKIGHVYFTGGNVIKYYLRHGYEYSLTQFLPVAMYHHPQQDFVVLKQNQYLKQLGFKKRGNYSIFYNYPQSQLYEAGLDWDRKKSKIPALYKIPEDRVAEFYRLYHGPEKEIYKNEGPIQRRRRRSYKIV